MLVLEESEKYEWMSSGNPQIHLKVIEYLEYKARQSGQAPIRLTKEKIKI